MSHVRSFGVFIVALNLVDTTDVVLDYYHAIQVDLPAQAGQLGGA